MVVARRPMLWRSKKRLKHITKEKSLVTQLTTLRFYLLGPVPDRDASLKAKSISTIIFATVIIFQERDEKHDHGEHSHEDSMTLDESD